MTKFSSQDIARYYDVSKTHYEKMWDLKKSRSLHYGYWDKSTKNFHEALLNINKVMAGKAGITSSSDVLDAGCGVGGSSLWLAKNIGCHVTGISLSDKQVADANSKAKEENLSSLAFFEKNDFTDTQYPSESFDVIWAIESVCHAHDKSDFIKEAFRLLKKGGRLILADFFKKEGLTVNESALIKKWAEGWAIDDFETIEKFSHLLDETGFEKCTLEDATKNISPSARRLYRAWFPGMIAGKLYRLLHPRATAFGKKNIDTAYLQYACLRKGLWKYFIVSVVKN